MTSQPEQLDRTLLTTAFEGEVPKIEWNCQMIVVRMAAGVRNHFQIRATEWLMLFPSVGLGAIMIEQEGLFSTSPSFATVASWAHESTWAVIVLLCALTRLVALGVNGTFQGFGISPHLRLFASLVGAVFWSQYCLGFALSAFFGNGAWTAPLFCATFVLMEILNISRSCSDIVCRKR